MKWRYDKKGRVIPPKGIKPWKWKGDHETFQKMWRAIWRKDLKKDLDNRDERA